MTAKSQNRKKRKTLSPTTSYQFPIPRRKAKSKPKSKKPTTSNGHKGHDSKLEDLYRNIRLPGSYSGIKTTRRYSGKSRQHVIDFLSGQDGYTLHKPIRTKFQRRKVFSKGIANLVQADLVDLTIIVRYNDGYRFLLTATDVFTKMAWVIPLKTKSGREVASAFDRILKDRRFNMLQTDKGTDFMNVHFRRLMSEYTVHHYMSENEDLKASVVERFNRTLKEHMFRYFSAHQTRRYLNVLDDLIESYNNTYQIDRNGTVSSICRKRTDSSRSTLRNRKCGKKRSFRLESEIPFA